MKFLVVLVAVIAVASAQYGPSGWKPQGARLTLPTEYGPPAASTDPQPQEQDLEVEITKENLQFVGQLGETTTEPSNEYLPPTTTEVAEETPEETPEEVGSKL